MNARLLSRFSHAAATPLVVAALACALTTSQSLHAESETIRIDGSSTVYPIMVAAKEAYAKDHPDTGIDLKFSGTSAGFRRFIAGEIDIEDASRPISDSEIQALKAAGIEYIELPIAFDALTIIVHPENDWMQSIRISELKKLWEEEAQGKVTHWNHVNPDWPKEPIQLYGAGADSGTFDYFTEVVTGKSRSSRPDYIGSEDDEILVQGVATNKYALGYVPHAYVAGREDLVKAIPVHRDIDPVSGEKLSGAPVAATNKNILEGIYTPFGRPLFLYVNQAAYTKNESLREFLSYFLENAPGLVREVGYLPMPHVAYEQAEERLEEGITGTAFGGRAVAGVSIYDIFSLKPEP